MHILLSVFLLLSFVSNPFTIQAQQADPNIPANQEQTTEDSTSSGNFFQKFYDIAEEAYEEYSEEATLRRELAIEEAGKTHQPVVIPSTVVDEDLWNRVTILFPNVDPEDDYWLCLGYDPEDNIEDEACLQQQDVDSESIDSGFLEVTVCGDGENRVKVGEDCDSDDFFHGGHVYELKLAKEGDRFGVLQTASFYVRYSYPGLWINGTEIVRTTFAQTEEPLSFYKKKEIVFDIENSIPVGTSNLIAEVVGDRPGKSNRNNYQFVLEGLNGSYHQEKCSGMGDGEKGPTAEAIFGNPNSDNMPLPNGSYILKVNDQNNEDWRVGIRRTDECQGGFTFYHVTFNKYFDEELGEHVINITSIEVDPNRVDFQNEREATGEDIPLPPLLCDEQGGDSALGCARLTTALGPISISPTVFITEIFRWVLGLAGLGGFLLFIYAAYQLIYSRGDQERIQNAKEVIKGVIIGYVFIVLSMAILQVIGVDILRLDSLDEPGQQVEEGS